MWDCDHDLRIKIFNLRWIHRLMYSIFNCVVCVLEWLWLQLISSVAVIKICVTRRSRRPGVTICATLCSLCCTRKASKWTHKLTDRDRHNRTGLSRKKREVLVVLQCATTYSPKHVFSPANTRIMCMSYCFLSQLCRHVVVWINLVPLYKKLNFPMDLLFIIHDKYYWFIWC